ncbi:MAG TPA: CBS domain-containing protein [Anaerolineaceae bacterium]|nr:CBS domain-containing protein [Anaerolineaceae bacterium]
MTREIRSLTPDMNMGDVLDIFRSQRVSGAPVLVNGELAGILSIEDIIRALRAVDLASPVSKYMSSQVMTIHDYDPVIEALKVFVKSNYGRLPVVDENNKLVGIITKGDITRGLLNALQHVYHEEEVIRYRASHLFEDIISDRTSLILRYRIKHGDFTHGGNASANIKRALLRLGANPQIARRCGIAIYEAEMNLIIHTNNGGTIRVEIEPHQISLEAYDDGPGIPNIQLAMQPGYSTASEEVREKGFGAGMGLVNIKRCVDDMRLESSTISGTNLRLKIFLREKDAFADVSQQGKETKK